MSTKRKTTSHAKQDTEKQVTITMNIANLPATDISDLTRMMDSLQWHVKWLWRLRNQLEKAAVKENFEEHPMSKILPFRLDAQSN